MNKLKPLVALIIGVLLVFASNVAIGNNATISEPLPEVHEYPLSKENWEKAIGKKNYTENFREIKPRIKPENNRELPNLKWTSGLRMLLYLFAILVLAIVIFIVIKYFLRLSSQRVRSNQHEITFENLDANFQHTNLDDFLANAQANNDYAQCIRIYYLKVIKLLSEREFIIWERDKTNRHYIQEMLKILDDNNFSSLTRIYEHVWFGKVNIEKQLYQNIELKFKNYLIQMTGREA